LLRSTYQEWFLPARIVLKREMDDHPRSFDMERAVYERLRPLQGRVVPRLLGQIEYDGGRALVLDDIGGVCLADPSGGMVMLEKGDERRRGEELGRLLGEALVELAAKGVSHDDTKLDNFHLVGDGDRDGGRIMVVDFELVDLDLGEEDAAWVVRANVESLVGRWREHLERLKEDGFLPREGKV
jgi:tRNA A-37 threonylcarbamoyl transferase component Bud32